MTRQEFVAILSPLVLAMRVEFDGPMWTVYFRALEDVPARLLHDAVDVCLREDRAFLPKPGELRALAETRRRALLEAHPYERCAACHHVGTVRIPGTMPPQYRRCECWHAYQQRLADLGIGIEPLALPPAIARELTQVSE